MMTNGLQIRDFQYIKYAASQLLYCVEKAKASPGIHRIINIGTGIPKSLLDFAKAEWERIGAQGKLLPGRKEKRKNELSRLVANISSQ